MLTMGREKGSAHAIYLTSLEIRHLGHMNLGRLRLTFQTPKKEYEFLVHKKKTQIHFFDSSLQRYFPMITFSHSL